jgi:hypothetical protein
MSRAVGGRQYSGGDSNGKGPIMYGLIGAAVMLVAVGLVGGAIWAFNLSRDQHEDGARHAALPSVESPAQAQRVPYMAPRATEPRVIDVPIAPLPVEAQSPVGIGAAPGEPLAAPEGESAEEQPQQVTHEGSEEPDEQAQAEMLARERAFMQERFLDMKNKMLVAIDAFYQLPEGQERLDYIQQFMRQMEAETLAAREAAGLPARPRGRMQGRLQQEFFQTMTEYSTPDERAKVSRFIGDMVQEGVRQWQRQMESQMNTPR